MSFLLLLLVVVVVLLCLAALFSGFETGLYVCDILRLRGRLRLRKRGAHHLHRLMTHRKRVVLMLLLFTNICLFFASSAFTRLLHQVTGVRDELLLALISTVIFTPFVALFAEMVPKDLFRLRSYPLLYRYAHFIHIMFRTISLILYPFRLFIPKATEEVRPDKLSLTREEIEARLREHFLPDTLLSVMVRNVFRLSGLRLRDVMIPASATVTVDADATKDDIIRLTRLHRFSRLPVVEDREKVVGVLHIFDMFYRDAETVSEVVRPPFFLGSDMALQDALFLMRIHKSHIAVITDERGAFIGIVTLKDIIEEITGELRSW